MCVRECLHARALVCLYVLVRTRAYVVGANAYALDGRALEYVRVCGRAGVRACVRASAHYACMI